MPLLVCSNCTAPHPDVFEACPQCRHRRAAALDVSRETAPVVVPDIAPSTAPRTRDSAPKD